MGAVCSGVQEWVQGTVQAQARTSVMSTPHWQTRSGPASAAKWLEEGRTSPGPEPPGSPSKSSVRLWRVGLALALGLGLGLGFANQQHVAQCLQHARDYMRPMEGAGDRYVTDL